MVKCNIIKIIKKHYGTFYVANIGIPNERYISVKEILLYHSYPLLFLILLIAYCVYKYLICGYSVVNILEELAPFISSSITVVSIFAPLLFSTLILIFDIQGKFKAQKNILDKNNVNENYRMLEKKIILTN